MSGTRASLWWVEMHEPPLWTNLDPRGHGGGTPIETWELTLVHLLYPSPCLRR